MTKDEIDKKRRVLLRALEKLSDQWSTGPSLTIEALEDFIKALIEHDRNHS